MMPPVVLDGRLTADGHEYLDGFRRGGFCDFRRYCRWYVKQRMITGAVSALGFHAMLTGFFVLIGLGWMEMARFLSGLPLWWGAYVGVSLLFAKRQWRRELEAVRCLERFEAEEG